MLLLYLIFIENNTWVKIGAESLDSIELGPLGLVAHPVSTSNVLCFGGSRGEDVFSAFFECKLDENKL